MLILSSDLRVLLISFQEFINNFCVAFKTDVCSVQIEIEEFYGGLFCKFMLCFQSEMSMVQFFLFFKIISIENFRILLTNKLFCIFIIISIVCSRTF